MLLKVGIGAGFLAAESIVANRLPRTLAKEGYADELKKKLARINQSCSIDHVVDYDNLAIDGKVSLPQPFWIGRRQKRN